MVKNPPTYAGDIRCMGSIPRLGRSPGGGHGNLLQHSCLENPMDRGDLQARVHRVTKSQTRLKPLSKHASSERSKTFKDKGKKKYKEHKIISQGFEGYLKAG